MTDSSSHSTGRLAVLSGPSGVGKSSIIQRLLLNPIFALSPSATTRAPRPGEVDGRDYHFLSDVEFRKRIDEGAFLEWALVHGSVLYGTLLAEVEDLCQKGRIVLLDIDVQGFASLTDRIPFESIFIAPPDTDVLESRLRSRGTESEEVLQTRIRNAAKELEQSRHYNHVVVNLDLEVATNTVQNLLLRQPASGE